MAEWKYYFWLICVSVGLFVIQIIHTEAFIGHPKVKSAAAACRS